MVYYCSAAHQKHDWGKNKHKLICGAASRSSNAKSASSRQQNERKTEDTAHGKATLKIMQLFAEGKLQSLSPDLADYVDRMRKFCTSHEDVKGMGPGQWLGEMIRSHPDFFDFVPADHEYDGVEQLALEAMRRNAADQDVKKWEICGGDREKEVSAS